MAGLLIVCIVAIAAWSFVGTVFSIMAYRKVSRMWED